MRLIKLNITNCDKENSLYFIVMTSTQHLLHSISEQLNRNNTIQVVSMKGHQSVFCQINIPRTSYHASNDWLQYQINLVTIVPVGFQQKNNLALNDFIDPKIILSFSARTWYEKWCLFCVVCYFCS